MPVAAGEPPELPPPHDIKAITAFPATPGEFRERYPATDLDPGLYRWPDLNGDGAGDLLFPTIAFHPTVPRSGRVKALSGWLGQELCALNGEGLNDLFGWVADSAGDFVGDGADDLLISAPASSAGGVEAGRIYVYTGDGQLRRRITCGIAKAGFGWSAATLGDVDGDGFADIIAGAPMGDLPGLAAVFRGAAIGAPVDQTLADAWLTVSSGQVHDGFGFSVASTGDVNGDGRTDFIVGAPYHNAALGAGAGSVNNRGAAFVYSGLDGSLLFSVKGAAAGMYAGYSVSAAGDLNGDGFADVVVGAPGTVVINGQGDVTSDGDAAYVFYGGPGAGARQVLTTADADLVLTPLKNDGFAFGTSIDLGNDLTDDGRPELLVHSGLLLPLGKLFTVETRTYIFSGDGGALLGSFRSDEQIPDLMPFKRDGGAGADAGSGGAGEEVALGLAAGRGAFRADLNADGAVDDADIAILLNRFGQPTCCVAGGDLNGDRVVDGVDLRLLLAEYGAAGPPQRTGDLNGDGAIDGADLRILLRAARGRSPGDPLAADVNGDGILDRRDIITMTQQATGGEEDELCDELENLGLANPEIDCEPDGGDGPLEPQPGPGPPPPVDCEELPRETQADCLDYAACVADDEHRDTLEELGEAVDALEDAFWAAADNYDRVFESGPERIALNTALATRNQLLGAAIKAAEKETGRQAKSVLKRVAYAAAGGAIGGAILVSGPIGWISAAMVGAGSAGTIASLIGFFDAREIAEAHNETIAALVAAGNGVAAPVAVPIALFNAGVAFAGAEAAFYAAVDAARQAMEDAFHAREEAAQAYDQAVAEYEETYRQARDECLDEILP